MMEELMREGWRKEEWKNDVSVNAKRKSSSHLPIIIDIRYIIYVT